MKWVLTPSPDLDELDDIKKAFGLEGITKFLLVWSRCIQVGRSTIDSDLILKTCGGNRRSSDKLLPMFQQTFTKLLPMFVETFPKHSPMFDQTLTKLEAQDDDFPTRDLNTNNQTHIQEEPEGFVTLWEQWPKSNRRVDRKKCLSYWRNNGLEQKAPEILAGLEKWKKADDWLRGFIPMPYTWLNNARWETPPERDTGPPPSNPSRIPFVRKPPPSD